IQAAPYVYLCMSAGAWPDPEYVVRATGDPRLVESAVRQLAHRLAPERPVFGMKPVKDVIDAALDQPRLDSRLLAVFAAAATLLAALGLYGLLTLVVTQRQRELGVRIALGASPANIVWLVMGKAAGLIGGGIALGIFLTMMAAKTMSALLFGVTASDAGALAGAVCALAIVSLLAAAVPAWRASATNAIDAIRA